MPTYTQLQAEQWWGREIVTPECDWLFDQIAAALGVPRVNVGAKGDLRHLNGAHRSQEWILRSRWCTNRTYTVQAGLTADQLRHLAGCDITPATRDQMLTISRNIDRAVRAGILEEVREWYGNVDGDQRVDGYNNVADRVASSDSSHLWHLHLSLDRRSLRDMDVMRRILAALLGTAVDTRQEDIVQKDLWDFFTALTVGETPAGYVPTGHPGPASHIDQVRRGTPYTLKAIAARLDVLLGRPALVITADLVDDLAEQIGAVLAAKGDNPLGEADKPAIKEAIAELLREGIAPAVDK